MSQLILDDQLDVLELLPRLSKWITARRLQTLRPGELILDDRVPEILGTLKQPSFVTIDEHFWQRHLRNPDYCILYFALRGDQQEQLPSLLRALLRRSEFRTRAARMGKVARVSAAAIDYWQFQSRESRWIEW